MDFTVTANGDRLEVTGDDGCRFTFPLLELQANRRPPRLGGTAKDLPVATPLQRLEGARRAAEHFAILNDLM